MHQAEPTLLIEYRCPCCGHEWDDTWTSAVDSDCPECDARDITPTNWRETPQRHYVIN